MLALWFACCGVAVAATTVRLPAGTCAADDTIFWDGFEVSGGVPTDPSWGSGGTGQGDAVATLNVPGYGVHTYYLHVPTGYSPGAAVPLVIGLHGAAGSPAAAATQAQAVRNSWRNLADAQGFVVVAPMASGAQGGWEIWDDYAAIAAILAAVEADYNIDRDRVYLWGFSAGGHVAWDLVFSHTPSYPTPLGTANLAGMAVSAGVMDGLACNPNLPAQCDALVAALDRKLPVDIHIGLSDPLLPYAQADRDRLLANGWQLGTTLSYHEFVGGHTWHASHLREAWADLCRFGRGP